MIEVAGAGYSSGGKRILHQLDARFDPGKLHAVVGPNGAGKSTLLKLMSGELRPTEGEVYLDGSRLGRLKQRELARRRAVLSQHHAVSLPFSVREVVMMGRYPFHRNEPSGEDEAIVDRCLQKTGVAGFSESPYPVLSGGEKQRVQLARTLAQLATVAQGCFLLDEPTAGMDLKYQYLTLEIARELADLGHTVIAVLHDLNMTFPYADQVVLLENGRMRGAGTPEEVISGEVVSEVFGISASIWRPPFMSFPVILAEPVARSGGENGQDGALPAESRTMPGDALPGDRPLL